jgi:hypothetical protein
MSRARTMVWHILSGITWEAVSITQRTAPVKTRSCDHGLSRAESFRAWIWFIIYGNWLSSIRLGRRPRDNSTGEYGNITLTP